MLDLYKNIKRRREELGMSQAESLENTGLQILTFRNTSATFSATRQCGIIYIPPIGREQVN